MTKIFYGKVHPTRTNNKVLFIKFPTVDHKRMSISRALQETGLVPGDRIKITIQKIRKEEYIKKMYGGEQEK